MCYKDHLFSINFLSLSLALKTSSLLRRIAQWPSATPLHQKSYGGLEDLKKTTNFITAAGLVVYANEKKKIIKTN